MGGGRFLTRKRVTAFIAVTLFWKAQVILLPIINHFICNFTIEDLIGYDLPQARSFFVIISFHNNMFDMFTIEFFQKCE